MYISPPLLKSALLVLVISNGFLNLQADSVRDAAWGMDWIGAPVQFQRSVCFIIAAANKEFRLTAGKFVPVCNSTLMNVNIEQQ